MTDRKRPRGRRLNGVDPRTHRARRNQAIIRKGNYLVHSDPVECPVCGNSIYLPLDPERYSTCIKCGSQFTNKGESYIVSWTHQGNLFRNPG